MVTVMGIKPCRETFMSQWEYNTQRTIRLDLSKVLTKILFLMSFCLFEVLSYIYYVGCNGWILAMYI